MDDAGDLILACGWKDDIDGIAWRDFHSRIVKGIRSLRVRVTLPIVSKAELMQSARRRGVDQMQRLSSGKGYRGLEKRPLSERHCAPKRCGSRRSRQRTLCASATAWNEQRACQCDDERP
jgi:hypothetical protein